MAGDKMLSPLLSLFLNGRAQLTNADIYLKLCCCDLRKLSISLEKLWSFHINSNAFKPSQATELPRNPQTLAQGTRAFQYIVSGMFWNWIYSESRHYDERYDIQTIWHRNGHSFLDIFLFSFLKSKSSNKRNAKDSKKHLMISSVDQPLHSLGR